jgi:hypothetical protein
MIAFFVILTSLAAITTLKCASATDEALIAYCGTRRDCPPSTSIESASLSLEIAGNGFHRTVHYSVEVNCSPITASDQCEFTLLQPLPATLFANIYELDNAASLGLGPRVKVFGKVDVESIEAAAEPTVLAISLNKAVNCTQLDTSGQVTADVKLHARYPRPMYLDNGSEGNWLLRLIQSPAKSIPLQAPQLYVHHLINGDNRDAMTWERVEEIKLRQSSLPEWGVPAANLLHAEFVPLITAGVVLLSAAAVVRQIVSDAGQDRKKVNATGVYSRDRYGEIAAFLAPQRRSARLRNKSAM